MVTYSPIVHIFLLEKYIQEISHFEMFTEFRAKLQFKDSEYLRSFVCYLWRLFMEIIK